MKSAINLCLAASLLFIFPLPLAATIGGFNASPISHQQIDLTWYVHQGTTTYTIHREQNPTFSPTAENRLAAVSGTFFQDLALDQNTDYSYMVVARDGADVELDRSVIRTATTRNTSVLQYQYDRAAYGPHQVKSIGLANYTYDLAGNISGWSGGYSTASLKYNPDNQLQEVHKDGYLESYLYDAFGNRVLKKVGDNVSERYFGPHLHQGPNGYTTYFFSGKRRLAMRTPQNELAYFQKDQLNSTTLVLDEEGSQTPVQKMAY